MNVLVLTPDRVGSTLLQRLITIYMNMQNFDRPVINLHELTNGLIKYFNPRFNQEVLGKPNRSGWGYFQTLSEVVDLLQSVDHYKTSRLAHYHIVNRQDSVKDQIPFYQYLNDNFFIIAAQRENLFEHALSWCIQLHSKKLNVFSHREKLLTFLDIYQNKITIDPESMVKYLDQYVRYMQWVDDHFQVSSYFKYERDLARIEDYILDLPIFNQQPRLSWYDSFGIDWQSWNQCHYLLSDLSGLSTQTNSQLLLENHVGPASFQLTVGTNAEEIQQNLSVQDQKFLVQNAQHYHTVKNAVDELVEHKVLVTPLPIKLQTMAEKRLLIKNFGQCVSVYNDWVKVNGVGKTYTDEILGAIMHRELSTWHQIPKLA